MRDPIVYNLAKIVLKEEYNNMAGSDSLDRCYQCHPGKYSSVLGSSSNEDCISCDSGKYRDDFMNPGEECQECPEGEISNSDFSGCIICSLVNMLIWEKIV